MIVHYVSCTSLDLLKMNFSLCYNLGRKVKSTNQQHIYHTYIHVCVCVYTYIYVCMYVFPLFPMHFQHFEEPYLLSNLVGGGWPHPQKLLRSSPRSMRCYVTDMKTSMGDNQFKTLGKRQHVQSFK